MHNVKNIFFSFIFWVLQFWIWIYSLNLHSAPLKVLQKPTRSIKTRRKGQQWSVMSVKFRAIINRLIEIKSCEKIKTAAESHRLCWKTCAWEANCSVLWLGAETTATFLTLLRRQKQKQQRGPSRQLTFPPTLLPAHTITSSAFAFTSTRCALSGRDAGARPVCESLKNPKGTWMFLEWSASFPASARRRIHPEREEDTGKLLLNCSPAGRAACCCGRGRPESKYNSSRRTEWVLPGGGEERRGREERKGEERGRGEEKVW